jgi:mannose-1-phosphate guanylyltransferase
MIEFMGQPYAVGLLRRLAAAGVDRLDLLVGRTTDDFHVLIDAGHQLGVEVSVLTEDEPLDTAGAARRLLRGSGETSVLVCNGDVLTDLDHAALVRQHRRDGAVVTLALTRVSDTSSFGVIECDRTGVVQRFVEKPPPGTLSADTINAGTYVLDPAALRRWEAGRPASIERDVFPALIADGAKVEGFASDAYWLDLGTPEQYLRAHADLLAGRVAGRAYGDPWVGPDARIDPAARIGRSVAVGEGAVVGADAELEEAVLLPGAEVRPAARVRTSIVGPRALVGRGATVERSVLGEGARVPEGVSLTGGRVSADALAEPSRRLRLNPAGPEAD